MALTLSQRMAALQSDYFGRRMDVSVKYHASRIIKGLQSIPALPSFVSSGVTEAQVMEWAKLTSDGDAMSKRMVSSYFDDPAIDAIFGDLMNPSLPSDEHDATVNGITIYSICWYACLINV